jgi:transcription-repair coupling factor (superfamily II helicase)
LNLYKRVSSIESLAELDRIREEVRDRYGPLPGSVESLLRYGAVKHLAQKVKIKAIDSMGNRLIIKFHPASLADLSGLTRVLKKLPRLADSPGSLDPALWSRGRAGGPG